VLSALAEAWEREIAVPLGIPSYEELCDGLTRRTAK
jgi:hypothetical protein